MLPRLLVVVLLLFGLTGDGEKEGRRGNALYKQQLYEGAADAYFAGLESYTEGRTDGAYYGLQNNLGAALHKQGELGMARDAFRRALEAATTSADLARAAYNMGNNEFLDQQAETALEHYKQALLADPSNQDAKFNYEFVKRQLEQQQQQDGENQDQQNDQSQDQQDDQQNQEGDNEQEDQQQNDQQQQPEEEQESEQDQQQQQQPTPEDESGQLSRQQAERILQALENEEEQLLREVQKLKGRPRRVEKDW